MNLDDTPSWRGHTYYYSSRVESVTWWYFLAYDIATVDYIVLLRHATCG